ncbi:MAG: hypothetical protein IB618_00285 [Candidatus Pacearchaeota archaeon]|nr:MAG: hypothetical protein IB618_00285 [Candidatus Pacearchaeota archaeon]
MVIQIRKRKRGTKTVKKSRLSLERYLLAIALATLFFIIGILIGSAVTSSKMKSITTTEEDIRLEMLDIELQNALAEYNPCGTYFLYALGERIDNLGTRIIMLENQLGKNDKRVIELKKPYTLLQIQHYLLIRKRIEKCEEDYTIILFFYSNKKENIGESEKQGYILSYLSDKYGYEKIKVYSIDGDLDLGIINSLKELYSINTLPSTVMNNKVYIGFHPKEEFEEIFEDLD